MTETEAETRARAFLEEALALTALETLGVERGRSRDPKLKTRPWIVQFSQREGAEGLDNPEIWVEVEEATGRVRLFPLV